MLQKLAFFKIHICFGQRNFVSSPRGVGGGVGEQWKEEEAAVTSLRGGLVVL